MGKAGNPTAPRTYRPGRWWIALTLPTLVLLAQGSLPAQNQGSPPWYYRAALRAGGQPPPVQANPPAGESPYLPQTQGDQPSSVLHQPTPTAGAEVIEHP